MFAMHLNHISQHLDLEFLWGEVLHIQVDRESVLLQTHLEMARWGRGKRKGRNVNDTSTISAKLKQPEDLTLDYWMHKLLCYN